MKSETDTPAPTFSTAQWGSQIPIDPALQQQSQQPTTGYYQPQPYYAPPQQQQQYTYSYPPPAPQATQPVHGTAPVQPVASTSRQTAPTTTKEDVGKLNDPLASAGVDLEAEERSLQRSYDQPYSAYSRPMEDRSHKQPAKPNFDTHYLGATMRTIGTQHKVTRIPEDSVNYLALSLRARLQDLITAMIAASEHRTDTHFDRSASLYEDGTPMWSIVVRNDVGKQLVALEKVEREEEMKVRRERKEHAEALATAGAAMTSQGNMAMSQDGGMEDEGAPKKKKKKDGPGVTARNLSQDAQKKLSNQVASQAAGLSTGKYAWMTQANAASTPAKPKPTVSTGGTSTPMTPATTTAPAPSTTTSGGWAKAYIGSRSSQSQSQQREEDTRRAITMRDAIFVVQKERGHGGGRGSARGWT